MIKKKKYNKVFGFVYLQIITPGERVWSINRVMLKMIKQKLQNRQEDKVKRISTDIIKYWIKCSYILYATNSFKKKIFKCTFFTIYLLELKSHELKKNKRNRNKVIIFWDTF